jgi:hypothetical protein
LKPAEADGTQVARLIAELDDDDFATRERTSAELAASGEAAAAALRAALVGGPSAEVRLRLKRLLQGLKEANHPAEVVREVRGVEVLEQVGTREARRVLLGGWRRGQTAPCRRARQRRPWRGLRDRAAGQAALKRAALVRQCAPGRRPVWASSPHQQSCEIGDDRDNHRAGASPTAVRPWLDAGRNVMRIEVG